MRAAEQDWLERQSAPKKKKTRAFWSVKFVRGKARRINEGDIDVYLAKRLDAVAVEQHAALATNFRDLAHRLDHTGLVVRGHDRNHTRFRPNRFGELIKIDNAVVDGVEPSDFEAFVLFQMFDRVEHGVMLGLFANDVAAAVHFAAR